MDDLKFIGGTFFNYDIPKEKLYLYKYFKTDIESQFIRYYYCFGNFEKFVDHTGLYCQERWLGILKNRHDAIVQFHAQTKSNFDLTLLAKIESGKCSLKEMNC